MICGQSRRPPHGKAVKAENPSYASHVRHFRERLMLVAMNGLPLACAAAETIITLASAIDEARCRPRHPCYPIRL